MGNVYMEASQINYRGGEKKMSVEEAIKNAGNTGLAHTADIAPDFSAESAYNAGDLVYHNGTLYVFTSNHSAGAWSTDDTQAVTVGGEITSLMSGLTSVQAKCPLYLYSLVITPTITGKISIPYSTAGISSRPSSVFVTMQSKQGFASYDFDQSTTDIELYAFEREIEGGVYTDTFIPIKANEPVRLCVLVYT